VQVRLEERQAQVLLLEGLAVVEGFIVISLTEVLEDHHQVSVVLGLHNAPLAA
jgi:hypothetical protein